VPDSFWAIKTYKHTSTLKMIEKKFYANYGTRVSMRLPRQAAVFTEKYCMRIFAGDATTSCRQGKSYVDFAPDRVVAMVDANRTNGLATASCKAMRQSGGAINSTLRSFNRSQSNSNIDLDRAVHESSEGMILA
jgi:hypothetical protein